ncbi:hypothetical protein Tco_1420719 [Tanacetum coccineum]
MFLYTDQLQKQLDNEEFQEIGSMYAFKVLQTQFQMFIKSRFYLDDEYVDMTRNKFLQYTRLDIPEFRDTLIQHMESVKKSIGERAQHKMEYESKSKEAGYKQPIRGNAAHVADADIDPYMLKSQWLRFASQVDVNNDLSKPVTTHHLPKGRESAPAKPHQMIAPSSSRYSLKYMYIFQIPTEYGLRFWLAKKKDNTETRASWNFDLISQKTFEQSSSSLGRQCQMVSAENNTSGPVPQCPVPQCSKRRLIAADQASVFMAMTSDHKHSELGIHDHSNEPSSSKLVPKVSYL